MTTRSLGETEQLQELIRTVGRLQEEVLDMRVEISELRARLLCLKNQGDLVELAGEKDASPYMWRPGR